MRLCGTVWIYNSSGVYITFQKDRGDFEKNSQPNRKKRKKKDEKILFWKKVFSDYDSSSINVVSFAVSFCC